MKQLFLGLKFDNNESFVEFSEVTNLTSKIDDCEVVKRMLIAKGTEEDFSQIIKQNEIEGVEVYSMDDVYRMIKMCFISLPIKFTDITEELINEAIIKNLKWDGDFCKASNVAVTCIYDNFDKLRIKTLDDFANVINFFPDWLAEYDEIIKKNGWNDLTGNESDICSSGKEVLTLFEGRAMVMIP